MILSAGQPVPCVYHQVAEIPRKLDPRGLAVPTGQFEQQMSYLAHNAYFCLTLSEAVRNLREDTKGKNQRNFGS